VFFPYGLDLTAFQGYTSPVVQDVFMSYTVVKEWAMVRRTSLVCGLVLMLGALAQADFTTIGSSSEPSIYSIMDYLYGSGNYTRINDSFDQVWVKSGSATADAMAKYAGYSQYFGYVDSNGFTIKITSSASGYITMDPVPMNPNGFFAFANDPNGVNVDPPRWSSMISANQDGLDHMITFRLSNGNYAVVWDDEYNGGDRDFNDFVVEVSGVKPVPEPATMILLGTGLMGLCYMRRRQKKAVA
jgi:hypothetical protein